MGATDGAQRFSSRADVYDVGRPTYPDALFELYRGTFGLTADAVVADIGAGTGIHASQLRRMPVRVCAVEPNPEMRRVAEARFAGDTGVRVLGGSAESTGVASGSVDLVVAAQAFHWFDAERFRAECDRILRPERGRVLVWNIRNPGRSSFTAGYEGLLVRFGEGYQEIRARWGSGDGVMRFFGREPRRVVLANDQRLDRAAVAALLDSTSYAPSRGSAAHDRARRALDELFETWSDDGTVVLSYDTIVLADA